LQQYKHSQGKFTSNPREIPYGSLILNSENLSIDFIPFSPAIGHVEVIYDVTKKELTAIKDDWVTIVDKIASEYLDKGILKDIVIVPILTGNIGSFTIYNVEDTLQPLTDELKGIFVDVPRKGPSFTSDLFTVDDLNIAEMNDWDSLISNTKRNIESIQLELKKSGINIGKEHLIELVDTLNNQNILVERGSLTHPNYLMSVLNEVVPKFNNILQKEILIDEIEKVIKRINYR